jgi:Protein of unknown function (DUF3017)
MLSRTGVRPRWATRWTGAAAVRRSCFRTRSASPARAWFHGGMDVRREWPFATVSAVALAAVALIALGNLQHGVLILGCALLLGSGLRFALPTPRAGLLAIRGRGVDVVTMGLLGLVMLILSVIPLAG